MIGPDGKRWDNRIVFLELRAPDLLVYWTPSAPQMRELPAGSVLLGAIGERERRFVLPEPVRENSGAFAVFSLAHGEVVAVQSLESIR